MTDHGPPPWSAASNGAEEDFSNFLDFHDVGLAFGDEADLPTAGIAQAESLQFDHGPLVNKNHSSRHAIADVTDLNSERMHLEACITQQPFQSQMHREASDSQSNANPTGPDSRHAQNHTYYGHGTVPRTPNTVEMHSAQVHAFTDPQALGLYEAGKHHDQMIFTPLASPAFQLHEYSASGEYFSPLTSPALQAQDYAQLPASILSAAGYERRDQGSSLANDKKNKRRSGVGTKDAVHKIRSSPAMKAKQKRRSMGSKTPREVSDMVTELENPPQGSSCLHASNENSASRSKDTSDTGSISPEPLFEVTMPPPAAPPSTDKGLIVKSNALSTISNLNASGPATPASLFRITKPTNTDPDGLPDQESQDNTIEPARRSTNESPTDLAFQGTSPKRSVPNTFSENILDSSKAVNCIAKSSQDHVNGLQLIQASPTAVKEIGKSYRSAKKRSSSSHVSPALRPRISPSIKPLLPGLDSYSSEATAALLANKSNYERIIDGSASQMGVNFPAQLSENLTSKRTSHKLAEQGRRNRINTALAEIQALLPEGFGRDNAETSNCLSNASANTNQVGASKAKTVENAIEYIKTLESQLVQLKSELRGMKIVVEKVEAENSQLKSNIVPHA